MGGCFVDHVGGHGGRIISVLRGRIILQSGFHFSEALTVSLVEDNRDQELVSTVVERGGSRSISVDLEYFRAEYHQSAKFTGQNCGEAKICGRWLLSV